VRWKPPILLLLALALGVAPAWSALPGAETPASHRCPCSPTGSDPCHGCCPEAPAPDSADGCGSGTVPGFCGCTPDPALTAIFVPAHDSTREHAHEITSDAGVVPPTDATALIATALPDRSPPTESPGRAEHGIWRL
jgi:hypothetical protein